MCHSVFLCGVGASIMTRIVVYKYCGVTQSCNFSVKKSYLISIYLSVVEIERPQIVFFFQVKNVITSHYNVLKAR